MHAVEQAVARGIISARQRMLEGKGIGRAARPLVSDELIRRVVEAAVASGAALAALPVVDTLKRRGGDGGMIATVDREGLWAAQTPQAFRAEWFRDAVARARADGFVGTDDASLVERLGLPVTLVEGEPENFKMTRAEDLARAEDVLAMRSARAARPADRGRARRRPS